MLVYTIIYFLPYLCEFVFVSPGVEGDVLLRIGFPVDMYSRQIWRKKCVKNKKD